VVETEIEDEGDGIEEEKKNSLFKIFENIKQNFIKDFTKQQQSSKKCTSGNGLGLFLSQRLVQYLDGHIMIESVPDQGTKVKVLFLT